MKRKYAPTVLRGTPKKDQQPKNIECPKEWEFRVDKVLQQVITDIRLEEEKHNLIFIWPQCTKSDLYTAAK